MSPMPHVTREPSNPVRCRSRAAFAEGQPGMGTGRMPATRAPRGGSVLILAIWTLFFLGALAVAVGGRVASALQAAGAYSNRQKAQCLARGAVAFAIDRIEAHHGKQPVEGETPWNRDPDVFRDNDSLAGGTFSIYCTAVASNTLGIVTNIGVCAEAERINLNDRAGTGALAALIETLGLGEGSALAGRIMAWPLEKKRLAESAGNLYAKNRFQNLHELLLVDGVGPEAFESMRPYLTLYGRDCFRGMAVGRAGEAGRAEYWIEFVYDPRRHELAYWHER